MSNFQLAAFKCLKYIFKNRTIKLNFRKLKRVMLNRTYLDTELGVNK